MGLNILAWTALAYFVGAIPTGYVLARFLGPSGLRPLDRTGLLSVAAEMVKGVVVVWLAAHYAWSAYGMTAAGIAVVIGSYFSFWPYAHGSPAPGAAVGALAVAAPAATIAAVVVWALVFALVRRPTTATLVAASIAPLACALLHDPPAAVLMALGVAGVVFARHSMASDACVS